MERSQFRFRQEGRVEVEGLTNIAPQGVVLYEKSMAKTPYNWDCFTNGSDNEIGYVVVINS